MISDSITRSVLSWYSRVVRSYVFVLDTFICMENVEKYKYLGHIIFHELDDKIIIMFDICSQVKQITSWRHVLSWRQTSVTARCCRDVAAVSRHSGRRISQRMEAVC